MIRSKEEKEKDLNKLRRLVAGKRIRLVGPSIRSLPSLWIGDFHGGVDTEEEAFQMELEYLEGRRDGSWRSGLPRRERWKYENFITERTKVSGSSL